MNKLDRLALRLFGKRLKGKRYDSLQRTLTRARSPTPAMAYMATAILAAIIAGVVGIVVGLIFFGILFAMPLGTLFALTLFFSFILAIGTYGVIMMYPSMTASNLKSKIDPVMPHAATYMYALTSGGVTLINAFKSLSEQEEEFGEVSREAGKLVREVEYFGHDIPTAIGNAAYGSPSEKYRNFLETLLSVVQTGGKVQRYFTSKAREYRKESAQIQKNFLESLGLLAETYIIALGLIPLLSIIMIIVMGTMGMFYPVIIFVVVYVFIPFGTIGFIVLINMFTKEVITGKKSRTAAHVKKLKGKRIKKVGGIRVKETLKKAVFRVGDNPTFIFFFTVPIAVVFMVVSVFLSFFDIGIVVAAMLIMLTPFVVLYEAQARRTERMEARTPDFLRGISSGVRSGLPLPRAVQTLSTGRLGALSDDVRKMQREIKWGKPTLESLDRFAVSTRSPAITRVSALVRGVTEAGGDVADVTEIASDDMLADHALKQERKGTMSSYLIIIYMNFVVFLFVAIAMNSFLIGILPEEGAAMDVTTTGAFMQTGFTAAFVKQIFFHATLIQAICAGIMAGMMGAGRILAGLKHALIMLVIGYAVFAFLIP